MKFSPGDTVIRVANIESFPVKRGEVRKVVSVMECQHCSQQLLNIGESLPAPLIGVRCGRCEGTIQTSIWYSGSSNWTKPEDKSELFYNEFYQSIVTPPPSTPSDGVAA